LRPSSDCVSKLKSDFSNPATLATLAIFVSRPFHVPTVPTEKARDVRAIFLSYISLAIRRKSLATLATLSKPAPVAAFRLFYP
jgi:hypothetical protein